MLEAKLEVSVGNVKFAGEGSEEWLSKEFANLLEFSKKNLPTSVGAGEDEHEAETGLPLESFLPFAKVSSLPKFLTDNGATSNQARKFLATAAWLQVKNDTNSLSTGDIAKALRESHQTKISNPSQELARNTARGLCEKSGDGFFVTQDGLSSLK